MIRKPQNECILAIKERLQTLNMSQSELARRVGLTRQAISNLLNNRSQGSDDKMAKICKVLNIQIFVNEQGEELTRAELEKPTLEDYVQIPTFNIAFGAGDAYEPTYEEQTDIRATLYRRTFFEHLNVNPKHCKRFRVKGDSMEPLILDGDSILVNTSHTRIDDGHIYVFCLDDMLKIKRLTKTIDGHLIIQSENKNYSDEVINLSEYCDRIRIIGEVIERTGTVH